MSALTKGAEDTRTLRTQVCVHKSSASLCDVSDNSPTRKVDSIVGEQLVVTHAHTSAGSVGEKEHMSMLCMYARQSCGIFRRRLGASRTTSLYFLRGFVP